MSRNIDIYARPDIAGASDGTGAVSVIKLGREIACYSYAPRSLGRIENRARYLALVHRAKHKLLAKLKKEKTS